MVGLPAEYSIVWTIEVLSSAPGPRRPSLAVVLALVVGVVVGTGLTWWIVHPRASDWFPVQVLEGNAYFNTNHTAFALTLKGGSQFFDTVGDAEGRDCIPKPNPSTADNIVMDLRVGVVHAAPSKYGNGRSVVVWIQCLGPPGAP